MLRGPRLGSPVGKVQHQKRKPGFQIGMSNSGIVATQPTVCTFKRQPVEQGNEHESRYFTCKNQRIEGGMCRPYSRKGDGGTRLLAASLTT